MRVGYVRASRNVQRLEPHRGALLTDGCKRVFEEKVSSREAERDALREPFDTAARVTSLWTGSTVQDIRLGCCTRSRILAGAPI